jgi:hypothetical protein
MAGFDIDRMREQLAAFESSLCATAKTGRDADRMREQLVALAAECPYTGSNPSGCPLHEVRKLEPARIIDWLDGLSGEEKDFLTLYHQCCLVTKLEATPGRAAAQALR